MARILFISLYDRNAYGQRLLSANLKRHGHDCHIVFLKRYAPSSYRAAGTEEQGWIGIDNRGREFSYGAGSPITTREFELLRRVIESTRPGLIGLTVNTPLRRRNSEVTRFIKSFSSVPVVWGGYDPTVNAAMCLDLCDYACTGEGDLTILELAGRIDRGESFDGAPNLAYKRDGMPFHAPRAPLVQNLDSLPPRDNEPLNKYFIEDGRLVERYPVLNDRTPGSYQTMTSRGCPYRCSYCCEASLKELYSGERFLRRRSPESAVEELAEAKRRFDLNEVVFEDEIFGMDLRWLTEFARLYSEHVDLPFIAYIYPTRNADKLLPLLQLAGLNYCCLALESGSVRINRTVFERVYDRDLFLNAARICQRLQIGFYTDVITYNPYEEESDLKDTLEVLLDIGGPFEMCVNKLFVLPGTHLAERMAHDGVKLGDPSKNLMFDYYCRLFRVASFGPSSRWMVRSINGMRIFRRHPKWLRLEVVEWLLVRRRSKCPAAPQRPESMGGRLRRLLEPPAPLIMNPAEPKHFRMGRWNLYLGAGGKLAGGYVNLNPSPKAGVDVLGEFGALPFRSNLFQRVECDSVLEHLQRPEAAMKEIERVLRPGGYAHVVAGFCHPFQEGPGDYSRFTLDGLKEMASGLQMVAQGWRTGPTATMIVFFLEYVKLLLPWRWWRVVSHGVFGWLLFPLRYLDLLLFRSPYSGRIGNHCYLWLRKPL